MVDEPTLAFLADYRFGGDIWGYPEGETYFPYSPLLVVESTFAEAVLLETVLLSIYNHDSAIASAASRMTWAAGDRPCIEMGSRRTHERAAVAAARAAYVAGFTASSNLRARTGVRRPERRHQRALLHPAARHRGRRLPRAGALAGQGHHPARRHLRHRRGGPARRRDRRARPRRGPDRLRRPRRCSPTACAPSSTSSARPKTRIIVTSDLDEFAIAGLSRLPRSTGTASAPSWSPAAATRRAASSTSWWPARTPTASWSAWPRRARTRSRSAAASTPCAASPPTGSPRPRSSASASPRTTTATTARCWCRWSATARSSGRERLQTARERHVRSRAELPLVARQLSKGDPVIETRLRGLLGVGVLTIQPADE